VAVWTFEHVDVKSAVAITLWLRMQSQSYNSTPPLKATTALQIANKKALYIHSLPPSHPHSLVVIRLKAGTGGNEGLIGRPLISLHRKRLLGDAGQSKNDVMSN